MTQSVQPIAPDAPRGFRAPGTAAMVAGGLLGALGAYLFQVVGGRALGPVDFAPVSQLWTAFFILATVALVPLEQFVTREASLGRRVLPERVGALALTSMATAAVGGVFVYLTHPRLFQGEMVFVVQMVLLVLGYTILFVGKGLLAGHRRFAGVGWILLGESLFRLVFAVVFLGMSASPVALGWAMVAAPFATLLTRFWRVDRQAETPEAGGSTGFLGAYILGSAASQLLLAGAPLAVAALGGTAATVSIIFMTFTLYRAPLTLIYSLQGRILPMLVRMSALDERGGLRSIALKVVGAAAVLAVAGGAVGYTIGSEVVAVLLGEEFAPPARVAALAAAGVVAASGAQVAGQVMVATGRTGWLAACWTLGLVVALVALPLVPGEPALVVAGGFLAGEVAALLGVALFTSRRPSAVAT